MLNAQFCLIKGTLKIVFLLGGQVQPLWWPLQSYKARRTNHRQVLLWLVTVLCQNSLSSKSMATYNHCNVRKKGTKLEETKRP